MRIAASIALVALLVGCATAPIPPAVEPAPRVEDAATEESSSCTFASEPGDDGWTQFTLCSPVPAWTGRPPVPAWSDVRLPRNVLQARERLLALGFPDVRGGELRDVEIVVPNVWGRNQQRRVRAIVLPGDDAAPRFAVLPPGLVWPVHAMGPPIDPVASCGRALGLLEQAATHDRRTEEHWDLRTEANGECPTWWAWPILVDRGELELAARALAEWTAGADDIVRDAVVDSLHAAFERAITHYMQREDGIARADVAAMERLRPVAVSLGVAARELAYLEPIDQLRPELERRAALGPRVPVDPPEEGPVPAALVPALIDALDEVDARQLIQPGGVMLADDSRVVALIRAGEPAIPALLECLEQDERLTRSVHFWRDFASQRFIIGVHEACYVAIASIIDEDFFSIAGTSDDLSVHGEGGRARVAAAVRTYWTRWGSTTPLERRWGAPFRRRCERGAMGACRAVAHGPAPGGA